jgi:hypothetical protein
LDYIIEIKAMILRQFAVFVPSFCGSFVLAPDQVSYFISLSVLRRKVFFFCRRAVWSGGKSWRDLGMPKSTFSVRLKKVEKTFYAHK